MSGFYTSWGRFQTMWVLPWVGVPCWSGNLVIYHFCVICELLASRSTSYRVLPSTALISSLGASSLNTKLFFFLSFTSGHLWTSEYIRLAWLSGTPSPYCYHHCWGCNIRWILLTCIPRLGFPLFPSIPRLQLWLKADLYFYVRSTT